MKATGGSLFGFVNARAGEFAIALDGQDDGVLAGGNSGEGGLANQMNRSLLWILDHWAKLPRIFDQAIVDLADDCVFIFKVRIDGEGRAFHDPYSLLIVNPSGEPKAINPQAANPGGQTLQNRESERIKGATEKTDRVEA